MPDRYRSSITRKGQITIPVDLRREFAVGEGDTVEFVRSATGEIVLRLRPTSHELEPSPRTEAARAIQAIGRRYRQTAPASIEDMKSAAAAGWTERAQRNVADRKRASDS